MSTQAAFRIDLSHVSADEVKDWVKQYDAYIVVREEAGADGVNTHVHGYLASSDDIKKIRNSLVGHLYNKKSPGNGAYSLKLCSEDVDPYFRYICKGANAATPPDIVSICGLRFHNTFVEDHHSEYYVNHVSVNKAQQARKRLVGATVVEEVEAEAKRRGITRGSGTSREAVIKVYLDLYKDAKKPISSFHCRAVTNTVCLLLDGEGRGAQEEFIQEITSKW